MFQSAPGIVRLSAELALCCVWVGGVLQWSMLCFMSKEECVCARVCVRVCVCGSLAAAEGFPRSFTFQR